MAGLTVRHYGSSVSSVSALEYLDEQLGGCFCQFSDEAFIFKGTRAFNNQDSRCSHQQARQDGNQICIDKMRVAVGYQCYLLNKFAAQAQIKFDIDFLAYFIVDVAKGGAPGGSFP